MVKKKGYTMSVRLANAIYCLYHEKTDKFMVFDRETRTRAIQLCHLFELKNLDFKEWLSDQMIHVSEWSWFQNIHPYAGEGGRYYYRYESVFQDRVEGLVVSAYGVVLDEEDYGKVYSQIENHILDNLLIVSRKFRGECKDER